MKVLKMMVATTRRSGNDKIDAIVDEICGFARIDRALLEFLPKNAVKRAAFTLDLASKVLDYFVLKRHRLHTFTIARIPKRELYKMP